MSPALRWFLLGLVVLGVVARVLPFMEAERMFQQYPTEDGYLMLTIARNLGIGQGFSVADGVIPTNGTQPLLTLVWAVFFFLFEGDRVMGVGLALVVELLLSLVTAYLIYRLALRVFAARAEASLIAWLASVGWFVSGLNTPHTMNCLETGPYAMMVAIVGLIFIEDPGSPVWSMGKNLWVGVVLGLAFWVRNDAIYLILGACLVHLYVAGSDRELLKARFLRTLVFGSTSVVVASPWMIFNQVNFGHLVPVSGRSEAMSGQIAGNLSQLVVVLLEYFSGLVALPHSFESNLIASVTCGVLMIGVVVFLVRRFKVESGRVRVALVIGGIYLGCLSLFYGGYFGASWFMGRYIFPATPLIILVWAAVMVWLYGRVSGVLGSKASAAVMLAGAVAVTGILHYRTFRGGKNHMHWQAVTWARDHVPQETWVGAVQTGTLGFFHDRTINLDGKVNPAAFDAQVAKRIPEYVTLETPIEYLIDWWGVAAWTRRHAIIGDNFEVLVEDEATNLAVLHRTTPLKVKTLTVKSPVK